MKAPTLIPFHCYVGHPPTAITVQDAQWRQPLPVDRRSARSGQIKPALTYGDYFTAVQDFLSQNQMALPRQVAARENVMPANAAAIDRIQVHLVKHGAFYHPALVTVSMGYHAIEFVLNVALSAAGQARLAAEATNLDHLHGRLAQSLVPRIYHSGAGSTASGVVLPMFAAQWFSGFHELHITRPDPSQPQRWTVWDTDNGPWHLSPNQRASFFRQAVFILARYFDPLTLSAIMEWHHGAGDFIVRKKGDEIDVRLITVRRYGPLFTFDTQSIDLETLLEALVVFWLKTSLWMRIDRLDGVGELAWADGQVVKPMWQGFVQGLAEMAAANDFPADFATEAARYFGTYAPSDLLETGANLLAALPEALAEARLIRHHLTAHVEEVAAMIHARELHR